MGIFAQSSIACLILINADELSSINFEEARFQPEQYK